MLNKANQLGAALAVLIFALCILIFVFRLARRETVEYWLGVVFRSPRSRWDT
jgi:hypothetical protein